MRWSACTAFLTGAVVLLIASAISAQAGAAQKKWQIISGEKFGLKIAFPSDIFAQRGIAKDNDGSLLVSKDGRARLIVGAFANENNISLRAYRQHIVQQHYIGADFQYAPVRKTWFVLSGTKEDQMFYLRVSFTCRGKIINSWAMTYPVAEQKFYNPIVEAVAKSFSPSRISGHCEK